MTWRLRRSLRARLVASLVLACAITLAAATLILLLPLAQRLRDNELSYLRASARHAAGSVQAALGDGRVPKRDEDRLTRNQETQLVAHQVARFARARVLVTDPSGQRVADTDRDQAIPAAFIRQAESGKSMVSGLAGSGRDTVARVSLPLRGGYVLTLEDELRRVTSIAATVRSGLVTAILIAMVAAIALGLVIGSGLSRRLRVLRDGALRVAAHGIDEDLPRDDEPDEIGDLAGAFELMHANLRRQEDARRAFVGTASHELRTPLTTLNGNLELLEHELAREAPDMVAARDEARRAHEQAQRLSSLATDLLELSRIDAGAKRTLAAVDLTETARAVLSEFVYRASEDGIVLELEAGEERIFAHADPSGVAQIVRVLVDNGLRFAPSGSALRVEAGAADGSAWISVEDAGPGVPAGERELVFERFRRGTVTGGGAGFGLGLAIAREVAESMDGKLELADDCPEGARFRLTLVREQPDSDD